MANTHVVLEGVKEYTRDLLGTEFRDVAVDAADRAEAQAERAEAAADNAEAGIVDDTVAKQHLTPGLRDELDGKADRTEVAKKADEGHTHKSSDITDAVDLTTAGTVGQLVKTSSTGNVQSYVDPTEDRDLTRKHYVDQEVAKKADEGHTHTAADVGARPADWVPTAAQVGARPDTWTPTAAEVGAATPGYVDSRIQEVTADQWPSNPQPGVIYWQAED